MTLVAVTGTVGKTTVVEGIRVLADAAGSRGASVGTLGVRDGAHRTSVPSCTPAPRLADLLELLESGQPDRVVAVEAYSAALARGDWHGCSPDLVVLTTMGRDHLDVHGDHGSYVAAKERLFAQVAPRAAVVAVHGSALARRVLAQRPPDRRWGVGWGPAPPGLGATVLDRRPEGPGERLGLVLTTATGRHDLDLDLAVAGEHLALDVVVALVSAVALGLRTEAVLDAARSLRAPEGRMQRVHGPDDGVARWVDFAHTPEAVAATLRAVRERTPGRVLAVLGCGGDRDPGKRRLMGRLASDLADVVVVTDDNPRSEDPRAIRQQVRNGCRPHVPVHDVPRRVDALALALRSAGPGDAVVALGMGTDRPRPVSGPDQAGSPLATDAEVLAELRAGTRGLRNGPDTS